MVPTPGGTATLSRDVRRPAARERRGDEATAAQDFLELSRLLDDVERDHPDISATLRLTLVRSRRNYRDGWLDVDRFRAVVAELTSTGRACLID